MNIPMNRVEDFVSSRFEAGKPASLPFSFVYGGRSSGDLLPGWKITRRTASVGRDMAERVLTCFDPGSGLRVVCTVRQYRDFPAVEWVVHLTNTGKADTPIIEQIRPLDVSIGGSARGGVTVHHSLGESNSGRSFTPVEDALGPQKPGPLVLAPDGGRSSNGRMPYFNLAWPGGGIAAAVGWSGQWEADFAFDGSGDFRVRAGQQLTHLKLHPGETIRTPRILFLFWDGADPIRGNNLFRQTVMAHYMPRRNGELVLSPICASVNWADEDGNYERPHVSVMQTFAERGIEVFWSDMDPQQWYPKGFPEGTGTWEPDPVKYPNGLKPVGDAAKAAGLGYLLWFEPERVHPGTKIALEHPEYVMGAEGEWSQLFRLHDERARRWLTNLIDVQITSAGINWLRWDFNIDPLGFWRRNDTPDRQGITEIRHIEGLYAMWDDLRRRHPGLVIDNCASGGRRIDLETGMRGLPLWHSDMQCSGPKPAADQLQNAALYRWVPMHGCGNFAYEPSYVFRSAMTAGNILVAGNSKGRLAAGDSETNDSVRKTVAIYKKLRPYMTGDFYPLLPHDESETAWYGYQFDNPDTKAGYAILFRREKCENSSTAIALRGVDDKARYEISFEDAAGSRIVSGRELSALDVEVPSAPGSAIVYYKCLAP